MKQQEDESGATFVDTPQGIFTASGVWFSATEAMLREYAAPVLAHVPLATLLRRAELWLRSPETLTLWALPLFLFLAPPLPAAAGALTLYVGWKALSPSFASRLLATVLRGLDVVLVQGLYYVFMLSVLAAQDQLAAVGVGLAAFVLLRWGLVRRAAHPLVRRLWRLLYALPAPDQVLRAFILRAAMRHGVEMPQIRRIEEELLRRWRRPGEGP